MLFLAEWVTDGPSQFKGCHWYGRVAFHKCLSITDCSILVGRVSYHNCQIRLWFDITNECTAILIQRSWSCCYSSLSDSCIDIARGIRPLLLKDCLPILLALSVVLLSVHPFHIANKSFWIGQYVSANKIRYWFLQKWQSIDHWDHKLLIRELNQF